MILKVLLWPITSKFQEKHSLYCAEKTRWERFISTLYKVCTLQAEVHPKYRLRVWSTSWGCAVQVECVHYRMSVSSTSWGRAVQAEAYPKYGLRMWSTSWGCAVQVECVHYRMSVSSTSWGRAVQAEAHPKYRLRDAQQSFPQPVLYVLSPYCTPSARIMCGNRPATG